MIVTVSTNSLRTRAAHIPAKLPPITTALVVGNDVPLYCPAYSGTPARTLRVTKIEHGHAEGFKIATQVTIRLWSAHLHFVECAREPGPHLVKAEGVWRTLTSEHRPARARHTCLPFGR